MFFVSLSVVFMSSLPLSAVSPAPPLITTTQREEREGARASPCIGIYSYIIYNSIVTTLHFCDCISWVVEKRRRKAGANTLTCIRRMLRRARATIGGCRTDAALAPPNFCRVWLSGERPGRRPWRSRGWREPLRSRWPTCGPSFPRTSGRGPRSVSALISCHPVNEM